MLFKVLACCGKYFLGDGFLDPAIGLRLAFAAIFGLGQKLCARPTGVDDVPPISRRCGVVDDQDGSSTLTRRFFIFVGPAAIIGHGFAAKGAFQAIIFKVGVIDHHNDGLALHIYACIVVPAFFRRYNAVANENHVALLDLGFRRFAIAANDIFAAIGKGHGLSVSVGNAQC